VAKIVYRMARIDFLKFREMAIAGLLEATFYEYLYLGPPFEEAERVKASLRKALEHWWDEQHVYASPTVNSRLTRTFENSGGDYINETIEARLKMGIDPVRGRLPCTPNIRNATQKRSVRKHGPYKQILDGRKRGQQGKENVRSGTRAIQNGD